MYLRFPNPIPRPNIDDTFKLIREEGADGNKWTMRLRRLRRKKQFIKENNFYINANQNGLLLEIASMPALYTKGQTGLKELLPFQFNECIRDTIKKINKWFDVRLQDAIIIRLDIATNLISPFYYIEPVLKTMNFSRAKGETHYPKETYCVFHGCGKILCYDKFIKELKDGREIPEEYKGMDISRFEIGLKKQKIVATLGSNKLTNIMKNPQCIADAFHKITDPLWPELPTEDMLNKFKSLDINFIEQESQQKMFNDDSYFKEVGKWKAMEYLLENNIDGCYEMIERVVVL